MSEEVRCFPREVAWFGDHSGLDFWLGNLFLGLVDYCLNVIIRNSRKCHSLMSELIFLKYQY